MFATTRIPASGVAGLPITRTDNELTMQLLVDAAWVRRIQSNKIAPILNIIAREKALTAS